MPPVLLKPLIFRGQSWFVQPRGLHCTAGLNSNKYAEYYRTLELPVNSDKETVRRKYIELVKLYHPDTKRDPTDKFSEIDVAYRTLQTKFKEDELKEEASIGEYGLFYQNNAEIDEEEEYPSIVHTTPQHRQYLDHGGFGYGTPSQRQKQNQKYRAFRANEAVFEHRMGRLTAQHENRIATRERNAVKKQTTRNQIERLVEDLIQESMASGAFDNLAGKGKPLPNWADYNPFADFTTHKMNQILVEGGFAPEWIMLRKDIRDDFEVIRRELRRKRQLLGPPPLDQAHLNEWDSFCDRLAKDSVQSVNKKIEKFNLTVPMLNGQMFQFNLTSEANKIFQSGFDPNLGAVEKKTMEESPTKGILQELYERMFK